MAPLRGWLDAHRRERRAVAEYRRAWRRLARIRAVRRRNQLGGTP